MRRLTRVAKRLVFLPILATATVGAAYASAANAQHAGHALTWNRCTQHLDNRTATRVVTQVCHEFPIREPKKYSPTRYWTHVSAPSRVVRVRVRYPQKLVVSAKARPTPVPVSGTTEPMLVTWYALGGIMADGAYTHLGAAACGYDLALGTRISVPGVGVLTCEDRIGADPFQHIDVWGYHPGLGMDTRMVTILQ